MPNPHPLTAGLVPPQLRAMLPNHAAAKPVTPHQAIEFFERIARWCGESARLPIKVTIDKDPDQLGLTVRVEAHRT